MGKVQYLLYKVQIIPLTSQGVRIPMRHPGEISIYLWNSHILSFAFCPGFAAAASTLPLALDLGCAAPPVSHPSNPHLPELLKNRNSSDPESPRLPNSPKRISGHGHPHALAAPRTFQTPPEAAPPFQRHSHSFHHMKYSLGIINPQIKTFFFSQENWKCRLFSQPLHWAGENPAVA